MSNKFQLLLIIFVIPALAFFLYLDKQNTTLKGFFLPETPVVHFGDLPVRVEIADSDDELRKGLSDRSEIGDHNGMFFVFPNTDYHGIWMKDMRFSIDIIWISEDLKVVGITKGVSPETYPKVFRPEQPVRYVLETEVNYADMMGIRPGMEVRIPLE